MNHSKILTIETANPSFQCLQEKALDHVSGKSDISEKILSFYRRFLLDPGIESRHFGMDGLGIVDLESADESSKRFEKVATEMGTSAVKKCLGKANFPASSIDGLIVTTCTGYLCPGLTSYISEAVGLRKNIYALDLVGIGCAASIPALKAADNYLKTHPGHHVLVLCVEVCSAAITWGDDVDLVLSNCIFSDGAAACILGNLPEEEGFRLEAFESILWPEYRDDLRFRYENGRLRNVIGAKVPEIASKAVSELYGKLAGRQNKPFDHYAFHPGGRKILDKIQSVLSLRDADMAASRKILRNFGNMSSPSVLYVLKEITDQDQLKDSDSLILFSFGAGFSAFGASLKYNFQSKKSSDSHFLIHSVKS